MVQPSLWADKDEYRLLRKRVAKLEQLLDNAYAGIREASAEAAQAEARVRELEAALRHLSNVAGPSDACALCRTARALLEGKA